MDTDKIKTNIKKVLSNPNTFTFILVMILIVVVYFVYNYMVNKAISPVTLQGLKRTLKTMSKWQEEAAKDYGSPIIEQVYGKINNKYTILDYKTSKKVYSTHFLQLGAYTYMMEEQGEKVEQVTILIVNNKCEEHTKSREEIQPYIDTFLILVELFYKWYDINKGVYK